MRNNMKKYRLIVLAISAAFLITGCGESTATTETTPQTQALNTVSSTANLVN
jgi:PBP1b-binding outer membrane lipoprotein LpoB